MFAAGKSRVCVCGAFLTVVSHLSKAGIGRDMFGDWGDITPGESLRRAGGAMASAPKSRVCGPRVTQSTAWCPHQGASLIWAPALSGVPNALEPAKWKFES